MSKVAIEEVESILLQNKIEPTKVQTIVADLEKVVEELKAEKEDLPKQKWEYVVVLHEPSGKLKAEKMDEVISAFVVQQPAGENAATVLSRLEDAASLQNETAKRKKSKLTNLRDIFDGLKSRFAKEKKLRIKTKEPVRVLLSTGALK